VCRSSDPRDRRTRTAALIQSGGSTLLIDTPPELRLQLVRQGIDRLDAVLYTLEHADHVNGIDDLRCFPCGARRPCRSTDRKPRWITPAGRSATSSTIR
jgi:phosphoribosyl 1,2-cyclic phosphate phosphodiesterase